MTKLKDKLKTISSTQVIFVLAVILAGGFNEYISCFLGVLCGVMLIIKLIKNRTMTLFINPVTISAAIILLGYLVTTFYAVDSGAAFVGFMKYLPVPLFMLLMIQEGSGEKLISSVPYVAVVTGAVSFVLMYIPIFKGFFSVAGRFAGTFQYPNTFAVFMLVGVLVLITKEKLRISDIIIALVLVALIFMTGSRAVFVLMIAAVFVALLFRKGIKIKLITLGAACLFIVAVFVLFPVLKENEFFSRFLSLSIGESTFAGRLLYWSDALPLVLKNPFGLGYLGHYYLQQSIQTGVYSVRYIHNDLLQIILDIGWLPCLGVIAAFVWSLFSRKTTVSSKIILITLFAHCLFDFDMQFTAMAFLVLSFTAFNSGRKLTLKKSNIVTIISVGALSALSLYFCIALTLAGFSLYSASKSMYPPNTEVDIALMIESDDVEEQNSIANDILSRNKNVVLAYSAKANYAFYNGDIEKVMKYKHKIFKIAPFETDEYIDYCEKLSQAIQLYIDSDRMDDAKICAAELIDTRDKLKKLSDKQSYFGKIIVDQPKTHLPKEIEKYISEIE